jgi:serine/threonine protein kinase
MDKPNFTDSKYENIKIIKKLAQGMMGVVYIGSLGCQKIIIKVSKIIPALMRKNNEVWKELNFYNNFAKENMDIIKIYTIDYKIIDNCNTLKIDGKIFKHPAPDDVINHMPLKHKKIHLALKQSKYCLINIMPYLNGNTLEYYFNKSRKADYKFAGFTKRTYYKWIVDLLKQIKFLHSNEYTHNDIHSKNIMIIDNTATLIDYGLVSSKEHDKKYNQFIDYYSMYYLLCLNNHYDEHVRLNKKYGDDKYPVGHKYYLKDIKKFMKLSESTKFLQLCKNVPQEQKNYCAFDLAEMTMPDFMKNLMSPEYAHEINFKELYLIDYDDVLYYIDNIYTKGVDNVIKHFNKKITKQNN